MNSDLPFYVKNKAKKVQDTWVSINNNYDTESMGLAVANKWLAQQKQETLVKRDFTFTTTEEQITFRSIGGNEYVDFVLTDTQSDRYGTGYDDKFLREMAELVNNGGVTLQGDFNHELLDKLQEQGYSKEAIKEKIKSLKQGVAKAVKAIYENGKIYLRALINPRYKKRILNSKGVSIEGSFVREGSKFIGGTLLGFSFIDAPNKEPGNPRSKILR